MQLQSCGGCTYMNLHMHAVTTGCAQVNPPHKEPQELSKGGGPSNPPSKGAKPSNPVGGPVACSRDLVRTPEFYDF
jgi:hypothetical protein